MQGFRRRLIGSMGLVHVAPALARASVKVRSEQATQFELWINLATTQAIGVKVRPGLLLRADRVIE